MAYSFRGSCTNWISNIYSSSFAVKQRCIEIICFSGLRLCNKATKNEMPVVVNYHTIRGCRFLRALSSNRFIAQTDFSRIHVPCLLFTDSLRSKNIVTNSVQQSLLNNHYLSPPLELISHQMVQVLESDIMRSCKNSESISLIWATHPLPLQYSSFQLENTQGAKFDQLCPTYCWKSMHLIKSGIKEYKKTLIVIL